MAWLRERIEICKDYFLRFPGQLRVCLEVNVSLSSSRAKSKGVRPEKVYRIAIIPRTHHDLASTSKSKPSLLNLGLLSRLRDRRLFNLLLSGVVDVIERHVQENRLNWHRPNPWRIDDKI